MSTEIKLLHGNIELDESGNFKLIANLDKARQRVVKEILRPKGSNKYHSFLGSKLSKNLLGKVLTDAEIYNIAKQSVQECIEILIKLQQQQEYSQYLTPQEKIVALLNVNAERDDVDKRQLNVSIYLQMASGDIIAEGITVRLI